METLPSVVLRVPEIDEYPRVTDAIYNYFTQSKCYIINDQYSLYFLGDFQMSLARKPEADIQMVFRRF